MKNLILLIQSDSSKVLPANTNISNGISIWFWVSIIELLFIIILFSRLKNKNSKLAFSDLPKSKIKDSKDIEINMDNLMNSIHGSRDLYKELSRNCHPDKFVNSPLQKKAEEIFQEISRNKRNHEKLLALKNRAISELNITF